jgi:Rhodopirellula transposase DDE domain
MFCHISQNWRGKPLISHEVVVQLIGSTRTKKGLTIQAELDESSYRTGKKISDEQMAGLNIQHADFHGEWNYLISP